ncbi:PPC domain-containing DNA-binding protein [Vannielia litorea]|uniref:PPC domain-containing DNA-binding protein n=1 Tax=Vannielia litorea TaxID=1217970 RepID=UPI001C96E7A8|nr:DUF296 domain-containing protein [Vannielia litorea]MBY6047803.1 DUF296 domain-containing protein [Vannielia litorea]MBY6075217.1 DUF296 domain-containing protein [Vannielia litorea]
MESDGRFISARLKPGNDLVAGLRRLFEASGAEAMAMVSCVGSLRAVRLRHAGAEEATGYEGPLEIVSLVGTLDAGKQHLHMAVSDAAGRVCGGHLMAEGAEVFTTAEIVVVALDGLRFERAPCPASGYDELVVKRR